MAEIGHNKPPGMVETANLTVNDINEFLKENPSIESDEQAKEAKLMLDRGKLCQQDMEAERQGRVTPLNEQVKAINDEYRPARNLLDKVINEIRIRGNAFLERKETAAKAAAAEAAARAAELERAAREAERREKEAADNAAAGELGVDVAAASRDADERFTEFKKASREAARAEKETNVKITGGFTRSASLRSKETLVVTDALAAVKALGASEQIKDAIIKSARAYRQIHDQLPPGVIAQVERTI